MTDLRLELDTTDFTQLTELGRSLIVARASGWTDHNVHDPGIMLVELLAWIADAQVYSLSRTRRDERRAYARLLGVEARGPVPAQGLVWPDAAVAPPWPTGTIVRPSDLVSALQPRAPQFRTTQPIQLTRASLSAVWAVSAQGTQRDLTRANAEHGASFLPFGSQPQPGDQLVLRLDAAAASSGFEPAFLASDQNAGALVSIGVAVPNGAEPPAGAADGSRGRPTRLRVLLEDDDGARPVEIAQDTTWGLARSGVILLRIDAAALPQSARFQLTFASASGTFLRPPQVRRLALNVLPIEQVLRVDELENGAGNGLPGQQYRLQSSGLLESSAEPLRVSAFMGSSWREWQRVDDLASAGPEDLAFGLDREGGVLHFGNGVNGAVLPPGAALRVEYSVSAGSLGNLPAGAGFAIRGVAAPFGSNDQTLQAGRDAEVLDALQIRSRRRSRDARPIVTSVDLEAAALSFTDLGVTRASELPVPSVQRDPRGKRVLLVMGPVDPEASAASPGGESPAWLAEVRARLAPSLPLGERLEVRGPRYVPVRVRASLTAASKLDPGDVQREVERMLRRRLSLLQGPSGEPGWPFGRDVSLLAISGWLRKVPGVARVGTVEFVASAEARSATGVRIAATALPAFSIEPGDISVVAAAGART